MQGVVGSSPISSTMAALLEPPPKRAVASRAGAALTGASTVSAGAYSSLAVLSAGSGVKAWGRNSNGQLGNGTTTDSLVPVSTNGLSGVRGLPASVGSHSLALRSPTAPWPRGATTPTAPWATARRPTG